jgi:putative RecB family exonuclease
MSLQLPGSLTPSKVSTFKECALAFRLSVIDKLPEPPTVQAFKGTVVHRALELLMWDEQPGDRTPAAALAKLDRALEELLVGEEGVALALAGAELDDFVEDARHLVDNYFVLEDPNQVRVIGTELRLQVDLGPVTPQVVDMAPGSVHGVADHGMDQGGDAGAATVSTAGGRLRLRGIIDRLELDEAGELVVTDYKTGRAPGVSQEQTRLGGVHFYAFLCQQLLGKRPARVQLFHLREPLAISTTPSDQSIAGLERQALAIWAAVKKACLLEDFRPKPGHLCDWCGFHAYCPAMGGDLSLAHPEPSTSSPTAAKGGGGPEAVVEAPQLFPVVPLATVG